MLRRHETSGEKDTPPGAKRRAGRFHMTVDQIPSELSKVLSQLQVRETDQFGQGGTIRVGWVDTSVAEELLEGATLGRHSQQLVGIVIRDEQVLGGVAIPIGIGRSPGRNDIDWDARFTYVADTLQATGFVGDHA